MTQHFAPKKSCTTGAAALIAFALVGCGQKNSTDLGSLHLKSDAISANGGTIEIKSSESALAAGVKIVIPPGALDKNTVITIDLNDPNSSIVEDKGKGIGPVIQFGPDGTRFLKPATVTLPYTGSPDPRKLRIYVKEANQPSTVIKAAHLQLDRAKKLVSFQIDGFTQFQCGTDPDRDPCATSDCGPALGLPNWICEDGSTGGPTGNCIRRDDGSCGWEVNWCPAACQASDCGPAPALGLICPDGTTASAVCTRLRDGQCGWDLHCGDCTTPTPGTAGSSSGSNGGTTCSDPNMCSTPPAGGSGGTGSGGTGSGSAGGGSGGGTVCDTDGNCCDPTRDANCAPSCDPNSGQTCPPPPPPPVCHANCTDSTRACPPGTECNPMTGDCTPNAQPCGATTCGQGEYCCNASCGICAPLGGACTQQDCSACRSSDPSVPPSACPPGTMCDPNTGGCIGGGEQCGPNTCASGEYCCNASCGICAPMGGACLQLACATCGANGTACPPDQQCDQTTGQCVPICSPMDCGPAPGLPNWTCEDGSIGGPTGQCIPQPASTGGGTCSADGTCTCDPGQTCPPAPSTTCAWEIKWCPRACDTSDCGPQPVTDPSTCSDGQVSTVCQRDPAGSCSWVTTCAAPVPGH
jgi:ZU5 domain-containing protein